MKILSLSVGLPRPMKYKGQALTSSIFKEQVHHRIALRTLNLEGDRQADLTVHGGPYKAVYAYPSEHYEFWRKELATAELSWGSFGENFTTKGLDEADLHIGDRFHVGSAIVMIRQPRMPCFKLAAKFQRDDIIERFLASGKSGVYFSVEQEGEVGKDDLFDLLSTDENGITIAEMNLLFAHDRYNRKLIEKAIATKALPESWREHFRARQSRVTPKS